MQVSIYLNDKLAQLIDRLAKKTNKSRSLYIQDVLEKVVSPKEASSVFDEVFGILNKKTATELLKTIQKNRINSPRFQ